MALEIMQIFFITIVILLYVVGFFWFFFLGGGRGHTSQMFLYTVFSRFSFSSCATHYETFPLEEEWANKCVKKPQPSISESFRVVFFKTSAGGGWGGVDQHAGRIL